MEPQTLQDLLMDLEQDLLRLGYTKATMTFYRSRWRTLREFTAKNGNVLAFRTTRHRFRT